MSQDINLILAHARHENTLLKTELVHALQQHAREIKEIKTQYHLKIHELQQILEAQDEKVAEENESHLRDQRRLQQENLQLCQKLKIYEDELGFTKQESQNSTLENLQCIKQKEAVISELELSLEQWKEKNIRLEEKINVLEIDIDKERTLKHEFEIILNSEKCQVRQLQSQLKDLKVNFDENSAKFYSETEKYQNKIRTLEELLKQKDEELKSCLDNENYSKLSARDKFLSLERNMDETLSELRQKHLMETHQLTEENNQLLQKLQILQRNVPSSKSEESEEYYLLSQKLQKKIEEFHVLQKENSQLKGKVSLHEELKQSLANEKEATTKLHDELEKIVSQQHILKQELSEIQIKFHSTKDKLTETESQLTKTYGELQKERSIQQLKAVEQRFKEEENLAQLQSRVASLEVQLSNKAKEYLEETKALKEKTRSYGLLIKKLRFRLESLGLKEKELEAKHIALKEDSVPSYKYRHIQKQLQEIINKHNEFKASIQGLGNMQSGFSQVEDFDKKLSFINDKLDNLELAQQDTILALDAL